MKSVEPEEHKILKEEFWKKNKRLGRPISPHLTIYKPQMTSMLSITHRGTGELYDIFVRKRKRALVKYQSQSEVIKLML